MNRKMIEKSITRIENFITGVAIAIMVSSVMWGVITRYITDKPAVWTNELSGILLTWVVFIGAMAAFRKKAHVNVPLIVDSLPPNLRRALGILSELFILAFLICATYLSYVMMQKGASRPSPVLGIPFSYVYLAPLVSFAVMSLHGAAEFWQLFTKKRATAEAPGEA